MGLDFNDWARWLKGLIGAGISGTAGALSSGSGVMYVAPDRFNLNDGIYDLMKVIAITAGTAFFVSIWKYLHTNPLPKDEP